MAAITSYLYTMDVRANIQEKTCSAKIQFQNLINTLQQDDETETRHLLRTTTNDLLARFILWAGNLGALQKPTSRLSLDHRLLNSADVRNEVLFQLKDIGEALGDCGCTHALE